MRRALRAAVPAVVLLAGLTAGCARDHGTAATPASAGGPSATPSAALSGFADMQKKVDAAESAASAADRDAAQDGTGR
ncbi:hypothetical protein ACFYZE_09910 [Streptomyces sp. NPDC001796]|uniref:hypothetical protein n=1 Tax=Streptomyces sp. NPDC001796 TaxID=3364609 RepID=UPI0036B4F755